MPRTIEDFIPRVNKTAEQDDNFDNSEKERNLLTIMQT